MTVPEWEGKQKTAKQKVFLKSSRTFQPAGKSKLNLIRLLSNHINLTTAIKHGQVANECHGDISSLSSKRNEKKCNAKTELRLKSMRTAFPLLQDFIGGNEFLLFTTNPLPWGS